METLCEPVKWPPTPKEIEDELTRDPNAARVRRPDATNPAAPPVTPESEVTAGYDLSAYTYRSPEAGVQAGGIWGRWFVSVSGSGATEGRVVRPTPLRFDMGPPLEVRARLTGSFAAVIVVSGSSLSERICTPSVSEELTAARTRNPHRSASPNGVMPVTGSGAVVTIGCTIPKIPVDISGIRSVYDRQEPLLKKAGIQRIHWMFSGPEFQPDDIYRQINWTISAAQPVVSGSWDAYDFFYNRPGYTAYADAISGSIATARQPGSDSEGDDALALNQRTLDRFLTDITKVLNDINRDSNLIRGLQIESGNTRIALQPARQYGTGNTAGLLPAQSATQAAAQQGAAASQAFSEYYNSRPDL